MRIKKSRAVFKEPQGFHEERPLTKLATGLMPRVEILGISEVEYMRGENGVGEQVYAVKLVYPWNRNNPSRPLDEVRGIARDEMDAYQKLKKELLRKGFLVDESS